MIGGGALRCFGILRGALAIPEVLDRGEVYLCDLDLGRCEAMGRMLQKTPELVRSGCQIRWGNSLEEALEDSDIVGVILPASPAKSFLMGHSVSVEHGFISSDNVSPNGAVSAVKIASVLMKVARAMEKICPQAWLINFVNPIAVLSSMINQHTKIRCLGVCAGFTNHLWDVPRIFGRDEQATELEVESAGINHLSYITNGRWQGEDLFSALQRRITADWQMGELQPWWGEFARKNIENSVRKLVRIWRELGVLIFSTEGDGMGHLMYDDAVENCRINNPDRTEAEVEKTISRRYAARQEADRRFRSWVDQDLDADFWENHWREDPTFRRQDSDIFVRIFAALAGVREERIATSRPNGGAIANLDDRLCVEYTQRISKDSVTAWAEEPYHLPDVTYGLTASLAVHQTLLGDALAREDPRQLSQALLTYPVKPNGRALRSLYRELFALAGAEIQPTYRRAGEFF